MVRGSRGIIKTIGRRITDLLGEDAGEPARRSASRARRTANLDPVDLTDLAPLVDHARAVLDKRDDLTIGRVNVIELDKVRERVGDRWPACSERIDAIVRRTIRRHLEPVDLLTPLPDQRYLVSFGRLPADVAASRTKAIGEEIQRLLLGEDFDGAAPGVQAAIVTVDRRSIAEAGMHECTAAEPPGQAAGPSAPWFGPEVTDEPGMPVPLADVELVYQPMWDVRRNVVSTFMYTPAVPRRGGGYAVGRSSVPGIADPQTLQALDAMTMSKALIDLVQLASSRRKLLLVVPLHFESVANTSRLTAYANLCRMVPSDLQQLLIFELIDVPVGIPQSRLLDLTTMLKRYSRSVLLRLPLIDPSFRIAAETGVGVVGACLSGLRLRERQMMRAFDRFCEGAHKADLRTYVHGLRTLSLTTAAIGAGFDYVDGDVVTSVVDEPTGIYRFDARTMIRNWAIGNI